MRGLVLLSVLLSGCATLPEKTTIEREVLPGIVIRADEQFRQAFVNKAAFDFSVELENASNAQIEIKQWTATIVSANQGNGVSSFSSVQAEPVTLPAGALHELAGYLYIGPALGTQHPEKWISKAVGRSASQLAEMSSERRYGDGLIGLRMELRTQSGNRNDLFLVKYHYDESRDTIRPYEILGYPIQPTEDR